MRVRGVSAAAIVSGADVPRAGSMSAKRGVAPEVGAAVRARRERDRAREQLVARRRRRPRTPRRAARRCRTRTRPRSGASQASATAASNAATAGPCVSQSPRSTSTTAATSLVVDRLAAVGDRHRSRIATARPDALLAVACAEPPSRRQGHPRHGRHGLVRQRVHRRASSSATSRTRSASSAATSSSSTSCSARSTTTRACAT